MAQAEPITEVVLLTGASRGLGAALAQALLAPQRLLICMARRANESLTARAAELGAPLIYRQADLSDSVAAAVLAQELCDAMPRDAQRYVLINNASAIAPMGFSGALAPAEIINTLTLNLGAPMLTSNAFLAAVAGLAADKRVLNISSGAARYTKAGWNVYCATKAGLDMFSRCLKAEQALRPHGAKVVSLAPGMLDTDMQATIRGASADQLDGLAFFHDIKANNKLGDPVLTAKKILAYIAHANFGETETDDLRNFNPD